LEIPTAGSESPSPPGDPLGRLERQVERGSLFTQAAMDRVSVRLQDTEAFLMGLAELLQAKGILSGEDLEEVEGPADPQGNVAAVVAAEESAVAAPTEASADQGRAPYVWPSVALAVEGEESPPPVEVNCAERMHICHAVCCKLNFALTAKDIDTGKVKWDLGFPFMIRHEEDGYCTHLRRGSGACGVYADRPGVCRRYSCANDQRIWSDFGKMELNHAYLDEYVSGEHRIRVRPSLPMMGSQALAHAAEPETDG
jgi:Fe-S-cluster containining protein